MDNLTGTYEARGEEGATTHSRFRSYSPIKSSHIIRVFCSCERHDKARGYENEKDESAAVARYYPMTYWPMVCSAGWYYTG